MASRLDIRWHGRGGQGTVTAVKLFADACLSGGRYVQAFPEYGPERSGAPLRAYNRISSRELRMHCPVSKPDIVVVVDPTLLESVDISEGTTEGAIFLINTMRDPLDIRERIEARPTHRVCTVDATKIAIECIGRPVPNAPMVGSLARISDVVKLEDILQEMQKQFGKKFSQKIVQGNLDAVRRGFEEVKII